MGARTLRLADEAALQQLASKTRGVASYVGSPMASLAAPASGGTAQNPAASRAPGPVKREPLKISEDDLQISCFQLVDALRPQHPILEWIVHVPNGGKRPRGTAGRLKAMGVKKGVLDLILPLPYGDWTGFAIELKVGKNKTTAEQDDWLAVLAAAGYYTAVCYTLEAFKHHLEAFLQSRPSEKRQQSHEALMTYLVARRRGIADTPACGEKGQAMTV